MNVKWNKQATFVCKNQVCVLFMQPFLLELSYKIIWNRPQFNTGDSKSSLPFFINQDKAI